MASSSTGGLLVALVLYVLFTLPLAAVFNKAGRSALWAFVPIFGTLVLLSIVRRPGYWFFFLIIPLVNIIFFAIVCYDLARAFGHGIGVTLAVFFLGPLGLLYIWLSPSPYMYGTGPSFKPAKASGGGPAPAWGGSPPGWDGYPPSDSFGSAAAYGQPPAPKLAEDQPLPSFRSGQGAPGSSVTSGAVPYPYVPPLPPPVTAYAQAASGSAPPAYGQPPAGYPPAPAPPPPPGYGQPPAGYPAPAPPPGYGQPPAGYPTAPPPPPGYGQPTASYPAPAPPPGYDQQGPATPAPPPGYGPPPAG
ncbi:MAG TPA: DUF5684 domain-containing protein [Acidimicrobiales bacterium]|nr:DUF5684 domain-containing protein [Acidimicrobiales bacterium]